MCCRSHALSSLHLQCDDRSIRRLHQEIDDSPPPGGNCCHMAPQNRAALSNHLAHDRPLGGEARYAVDLNACDDATWQSERRSSKGQTCYNDPATQEVRLDGLQQLPGSPEDLEWIPALAPGTQPERVAEVDRIPAREPIQIEPTREPDRIFLGECPIAASPVSAHSRPRPRNTTRRS